LWGQSDESDLRWTMAGLTFHACRSLLDTRQRYRALSIEGVADAVPVVIGFADWKMPSGETAPVFVVGSDLPAR
jgi:hypothetical protein